VQIEGFSGAEYKKFKTEAEATEFMNTKTVSIVKPLDLSVFAYSEPNMVLEKVSVEKVPEEKVFSTMDDLSPEQIHAFERYRLGHNVFITGPGGTGKSYLIKTIKADLEQREIKHAVCGLTGCASVLLNCCAKTIHSWSGVGLGAGEIHEIVDKAVKNRKANANWKSTRVLIVDEVSMMSVKLFDALNKIGQTIRRNPFKPFGNMQIIFIGDFFQLPPVGRYTEPETTMFCFQSANWFSTFSKENHVILKTLFLINYLLKLLSELFIKRLFFYVDLLLFFYHSLIIFLASNLVKFKVFCWNLIIFTELTVFIFFLFIFSNNSFRLKHYLI
jgi:hypothetical protein